MLIHIDTQDLSPSDRKLLRFLGGSEGVAVSPDTTSVVTSDPADVTCNEATVDDAVAKKAAKAAKAKATREKKKADKVQAEIDAAAEVTTAEVLGDAPAEEVSVDLVRAAVVSAIDRLTASGAEAPTKPVVAKLEDITGKRKVGEVDASQYQEVIDGLALLGV